MEILYAKKTILSDPNRSIKIDYETRNRTISTIQVRFKYTYYMDKSISYFGYSQFVTATLNSEAQSRLTLKENNPNNWYNSPIEVTSGWYTVSLSPTATSLACSFKFTSNDPDDSTSTINAIIKLEALINQLNAFANNISLNLEEPLTLSISQYNSSSTNNLILYFKDNAGKSTKIANWTNVVNNQQISLTQTQINTLFNLTPTNKFYNLTWELITINTSGTSLGSMQLQSAGLISNANPMFDSTYISYEDINTTTIALTGNNQHIINEYSNVKITIKLAVAQKGASISHYIINDNPVQPNELPYTLKNITSQNITVYAVDTRGNSTPAIKTITNFINYQKLGRGNSNIAREGGASSQAILNFDGVFWNGNFGAKANKLKTSYKYKKTTSQDYIQGDELTLSTNDSAFSFNNYIKGDAVDNGFVVENLYNIIVTVKDELSEIQYDNLVLNAGTHAIIGYQNRVALGGTTYDKELGGTQVWGDCYIDRNLLNGLFPTVLYEGSTTTVATLSQSVSKFKRTKIFFNTEDGHAGSVEIYNNNSANITTSFIKGSVSGTAYYGKTARCIINGTSLTIDRENNLTLKSTNSIEIPESNGAITVTRVEGYLI